MTDTRPLRTKAPRLLYIAAAFPPYAVPEADFAYRQCLQLAKEGVEVHVLTTRREGVAQPPELRVHAVMENWSWREFGRLWRVVRRVRPDAGLLYFLGWLYNYQTMVTVAPALVKVVSRRARFITYFSNLGSGGAKTTDWRNRLRRFVFQKVGRLRYGALLPLSDRLLVLSQVHADKLAEIHPRLRDKTDVIPPPSLIPMLPDEPSVRSAGRKALDVPDDAFLFTYFGRILPGKGIKNLLGAFAEIADEMPDAHLALVGGHHSTEAWFARSGYAEELDELVERLGIADRLSWSGEYDSDSDDPSRYLRASDVAVLPFASGVQLLNSSFAAVCAHGLPTITTARNVERPIEHGHNAYLIAPEDQDVLREALRTLYRDGELRRALGEGVSQLAQECFSWDRAIERQLHHLRLAGR